MENLGRQTDATIFTISGSRRILNEEKNLLQLNKALLFMMGEFLEPFEIMHGGAVGVDQLAQELAKRHTMPVHIIEPDYKSYYKKEAPLRRNDYMVNEASAVICYYCGNEWRTGGTGYTAKQALKMNRPLLEINQMGKWHYTPPTPTLF